MHVYQRRVRMEAYALRQQMDFLAFVTVHSREQLVQCVIKNYSNSQLSRFSQKILVKKLTGKCKKIFL